MKIDCHHCGSTGKIESSFAISPGFKKAYVKCSNPKCNCRWVVHISHSHDLDPPTNNAVRQVEYLLDHMQKDERAALLDRYAVPVQDNLF